MLRFKHGGLESEFGEIDRRLRAIVYALVGYIHTEFRKDLIITSVIRKDNHKSVHYYGRGVDFRITPKGGEPYYTGEELEQIQQFCQIFEYSDRHRKAATLVCHDSGSGYHGHFQVSPQPFTRIKLLDFPE